MDRKAEGSTGHHPSWFPSPIPLKSPRETRWKPARDATTRPRHGDGCCDCAVTTTMLSSLSAAVNPALGRPLPSPSIFIWGGGEGRIYFYTSGCPRFFFSSPATGPSTCDLRPCDALDRHAFEARARAMRCDALRMGSGRSASKTRARGWQGGGRERAEASLCAGTDDPVRPVTG